MAKPPKRSLSEIEAEIDKLKREAEALRASELAEVIGKIKTAIAAYGLTAADLGLAASSRRASKGSARGSATGRKTRPAKYADGQGNTWVGQGKRPGWFVAALASGKSPEDLLIKRTG